MYNVYAFVQVSQSAVQSAATVAQTCCCITLRGLHRLLLAMHSVVTPSLKGGMSCSLRSKVRVSSCGCRHPGRPSMHTSLVHGVLDLSRLASAAFGKSASSGRLEQDLPSRRSLDSKTSCPEVLQYPGEKLRHQQTKSALQRKNQLYTACCPHPSR